MSDCHNQEGPLRLPPSPPSPAASRAVREKLRGHSTAANWLPEGVWPELDELRGEQLRVRGQVVAELTALEAVESRFRAEDEQHEQQLRQAHRDGRPGSVEDRRTPPDQRQAERAAVEERLWAGVVVLAEVTDSVIGLVREREDHWLADLRGQLEPAREKRREAQRLSDEARREEWVLHQLGGWLQNLANDGPFGRQPHPTPSPPPAQFSAEIAAGMLERQWHKRRAEEMPRSWQERSEAEAERNADVADPQTSLPAEDETGLVSPLDASHHGTAA